MMMLLGNYCFSLATAAYQDKKRNTEYRWSQTDNQPHSKLVQFIGSGNDTLTLHGVIFTEYKGGLAQVDGMRSEAAKGKPLFLIQGDGQVLGQWIILAIEETQTHCDAQGNARQIDFSLSLQAYDNPTPIAWVRRLLT